MKCKKIIIITILVMFTLTVSQDFFRAEGVNSNLQNRIIEVSNKISTDLNTIELSETLYTRKKGTVDAENVDGWEKIKEAIKIDDNSTLRVSYDDNTIYFLVEVLDSDIQEGDSVDLFYIGNKNPATRCFRINCIINDIENEDVTLTGSKLVKETDGTISNSSYYTYGHKFKRVTDDNGNTIGYKVEFAIDRTICIIRSGELKVDVVLNEKNEENINNIYDTFTATDVKMNVVLGLQTYPVEDTNTNIENLKIQKEEVKNKEIKDVEDNKVVDLMLFMGQSNMVGYGNSQTAEAPITIDGETVNKEFKLYSNDNKSGTVFDETEIEGGSGELVDLQEPFGSGQNKNKNGEVQVTYGSMVTALTNSYYTETGVPVVAISSAVGGMSIYSWWNEAEGEKAEGQGLTDAKYKYEKAIKYLNENGYTVRYKYMIWCQGCADSRVTGYSTSTYEEKFKTLVSSMYNLEVKDASNNVISSGIDKAFVVRIGYYEGNYNVQDDIINKQTEICTNNSYAVLASTSFKLLSLCKSMMTNSYNNVDPYHYNQSGYELTGYDAGKNIAYYSNTGQENNLTDYEYNEDTKTIDTTTYNGYNTIEYNSSAENGYVTVTIHSNEEMKQLSGWKLSSDKKSQTKVYIKNTDEKLVIYGTDNEILTTVLVKIDNIKIGVVSLRKSITVKASNKDNDINVIGYKYSIDGNNYTDVIRKQDEYIFKDLTSDTDYTIYAEPICKDGTSLETVSVTTKTLKESTEQAKIVNVQDYGANPDDEDIDTTAIKNALANCKEGDTLYFPEGTYLIDSTIVITTDKLTILGENITDESGNIVDKSIIKHVKNANTTDRTAQLLYTSFTVNSTKKSVEGVTFKNLTVDSNKDERADNSGTYFSDWGYGYGRGCAITATRYYIENVVSDVSVINCHIMNVPCSGIGLAGTKVTDNFLKTDYAYNEKTDDKDEREETIFYPVYGTLVENCKIENCRGGVIQNTTSGTNIVSNEITNTIVENITMDYVDNCTTIGNKLSKTHGGCGNIGTDASNNCVIMGNYIDSTNNMTSNKIFNVGICHNSAAGKSNNFVIANNTIINAFYGIWLKDHREYLGYSNCGSRAGSNFVILNNTISDDVHSREEIETYNGNTYSPSDLKIDEMIGATYVSNNTYADKQIVEGDNIILGDNNNSSNKAIKSIYIKTPIKDTYIQDFDNLDVSGGILTVNYTDGTYEDVNITEDMISGFDNTLSGTNTLTLTYKGNKKYSFDMDGSTKSIYEEIKLSFNVYIVKRVLVHHYIENTTQNIIQDEAIYSRKGKVFDVYTTSAAQNIPEKYELVQLPENNTGTMIEGTTEVIYYYKELIKGDINEDKKVNISDLLLLKRHLIAGSKTEWILTERRQKIADINEDGKVNISDLLLLKRFLLNKM